MDRAELAMLLGTSSQPTTGEVRRARRLLARHVHPDAAGARSSSTMSELNAACDEWLAEIRARRDAPPRVPPTPVPTPRPPIGRAAAGLPWRYAAATVVLVAVIVGVVIALVGVSATSLAAGALLGAGAAAVFAILVYQRVIREAGRR